MSRENWWLDYVEDELDASTRAEMRSLLRSSKKDQEIVQSLSDAKTILKENSKQLQQFSDDYLDHLHDQIMSQVAQTEIQKAPKFKIKAVHKKSAKAASASLLLFLCCFCLRSYLNGRSLDPHWDVTRQMVLQSESNPLELTQLMTYQNENDFFVDVASLSLDHLTKEQFETLMKTTKTR